MLKQRYCSINELSQYTGLPIKTIYEWASTGVFPSIKIRKRVLFDILEVDDFLRKMKRNSHNPEEIADKIIREINEDV